MVVIANLLIFSFLGIANVSARPKACLNIFEIFKPSSSEKISLNYKIERSSGNTKNVVLLHGLGEDIATLNGLAERLKAAKINVLRVDLQGHGKSLDAYLENNGSIPKIFPYKNNIPSLVEIIRAEKFEKPIIVGHSYGAAIAYALAEVLQTTTRYKPTHVVMMAPYLQRLDQDFLNSTGWAMSKKQQEAYLDNFMRTQFRKILLKELDKDEQSVTPEESAMIDQRVSVLIALTKGIRSFDLLTGKTKLLQQRIPILILAGTGDALIKPEYVRRLNRILNKSDYPHKTVFMEGSDHYFPKQRPAVVIQEILKFISESLR